MLDETSRRTGCPAFAGHDDREHGFVLPRRKTPESVKENSHPLSLRAQGMPGARCARSLVCKVKKHTSIVTTVAPRSPGIPRAMVLTASFALFPAIGLSCHRRLQDHRLTGLISASRYQNHTTSPSALTCSSCASRRPSHPAPNVRDDREAPLLWARDARRGTTDLPVGASAIFLHEGWMTRSA